MRSTGKSSSHKEAEKWKSPTPRCVHTCACMCVCLCAHAVLFSPVVWHRVSSHWTQKPERPPKFESRTIGALNAIAEEHWKRWQEAEVDRETDASEQLAPEDSQRVGPAPAHSCSELCVARCVHCKWLTVCHKFGYSVYFCSHRIHLWDKWNLEYHNWMQLVFYNTTSACMWES